MMVEHVARALCRAAAAGGRQCGDCPFCDRYDRAGAFTGYGECLMWQTFVKESEAAIEAVRDFARLTRRGKPRPRDATQIVSRGPTTSQTTQSAE